MVVIMPDSNFFMNNQAFLLIILLIVILQLRRRKVRFWSLFILPALLSIITIPLAVSEFNTIFNAVIIIIGILVGILVGILIARFYEVEVDENGSMILKGSYLAIIIWIAIILIKFYGKNALTGTGLIKLDLLTTALLLMTLAAMFSRRIVVYWKYWNFKKNKKVKSV